MPQACPQAPTVAQIINASQYERQPDATISQANPVSATLYPVLATTANAQIISIEADITWAVTQPTPLEVIMTIDGQTIIYLITNPVSAQEYIAAKEEYSPPANQLLLARNAGVRLYTPPYLCEGRSIKIEARITWAITQPTPLVCRVKWAKR